MANGSSASDAGWPMSFQATDELLVQGLAAARGGDRRRARFYLEWVLRDGPSDQQCLTACYWLSRLAETAEEQRTWLEQVLSLAPLHPEARRDLARLDGRLAADEPVAGATELPLSLAPHLADDDQAEARARCRACGGLMRFSPVEQRLTCQFCGQPAGSASPAGPVAERDWFAVAHTARGHRWLLPADQLVNCQGCGAVERLPTGQVGGLCPFCGSPQLARLTAEPMILAPDGILSFQLDAAAAEACLTAWRRRQRRREWRAAGVPRPIYLPFWRFEIAGEAEGRPTAQPSGPLALAGQPPTIILPLTFSDLLVPASRSLPAPLLSQLHFDLSAAVPYHDELLLGWPVELYQVPVTDASLAARQQALALSRVRLAAARPAGEEELQIVRLELAVDRYALLLLPLWLVTAGPRRLLINGQNGALHAESEGNPLDRLLSWLTPAEGDR